MNKKAVLIISIIIPFYFISCAQYLNDNYGNSDAFAEHFGVINNTWYPSTTPTPSWTGSGTENNPYVITTAEQLADLAYLVNNGNSYATKWFSLGTDIELNEGYTVTASNYACKQWTPIGDSENKFSGTFDGCGHSINGLYIDASLFFYTGLFGQTDSACIRNLTISSGYICSKCRYSDNSTYGYSGGIVGFAKNTTIYNCGNNVNISAQQSSSYINVCVGGIAGGLQDSYVYNSFYKGSVATIANGQYLYYLSGKVYSYSKNTFIGGIAGTINTSTIENCYTIGKLTCNVKEDDTIASSSVPVGGIAGNAVTGTVSCCYWLTSSASAAYGVKDSCNFSQCSPFAGFDYEFTNIGKYTGSLLTVLNLWVSDHVQSSYYTWATGSDSYPMFSNLLAIYTITYVLNEGANDSKNATTYTTYQAVALYEPTKTGYLFEGWYSDSSFITKVENLAPGTTGDITLYAKWGKSIAIVVTSDETDLVINTSTSQENGSVTITAVAGYATYVWMVDDTVQANTTNSITLDTLTMGYHMVMLQVTESNGNSYSATCYVQKKN